MDYEQFTTAAINSPPPRRLPLSAIDNIQTERFSPKPLPSPGLVTRQPESPSRDKAATHHRLAKWKQRQYADAHHPAGALRSTLIDVAEVIETPSASTRKALEVWTQSDDDKALQTLTAGFTLEEEGVKCLGISKLSVGTVDAQQEDWLWERARRKAAALDATFAGALGHDLRSWPALHQEEAEEEAEEEGVAEGGEGDEDEEAADEALRLLRMELHAAVAAKPEPPPVRADAFEHGAGPLMQVAKDTRPRPLSSWELLGLGAVMLLAVTAALQAR